MSNFLSLFTFSRSDIIPTVVLISNSKMAISSASVEEAYSAFVAGLDPGSTDFQFKEILQQQQQPISDSDPRELFTLGEEADSEFPEVLEIFELRRRFIGLSAPIKSRVMRDSIVKFVHLTNAIEFAAPDTEAHTDAILFGGASQAHHDNKGSAVIATYNQLKSYARQSLFESDTPEAFVGFDPLILSNMHALLGDCPRDFRNSGVKAQNKDGSEHIYPHHSIVPDAMGSLTFMVFHLLKRSANLFSSQSSPRILSAFSIAAFYQYHFVSIHPFSDGNGRMCRLLSKLILDWVMPLPIPMFEHRDDYLCTIEAGRQQADPKLSHVPLLKLLLATAKSHLQSILKTSAAIPNLVLCARQSSDVLERIQRYRELSFLASNADAVGTITAAFEALAVGEESMVDVSHLFPNQNVSRIHVLRWPAIDFDSIANPNI
jgi:hypothetical protein